jgi:tetratricopeptide (TPR) repeat protein
MRIVLLLLIFFAAAAAAQRPEAERLFESAMAAQQRGDFPAAIRDYQKLLELNPNMVDARVNLGAALAHAGRFDEAIAQYRLALASTPDNSAVRRNLGLAYYKKGDLADAVHEFQEIRKVQPKDAQLAILLGDSEVKLGKGADAVVMLLPLEADNESNPDFQYVLGAALVQSGRPREGIPRLEKMAASTHSADAYLLAGATLLDIRQFERARVDLEAALVLDSKLPHIYSLTGTARDKTGDVAQAEIAFREALRIDSNDFDANLYLGAILFKRRNVDQAKPHLEKALQLNPASSMARYEVAMWKSNSGQYEDAAKDLEAVIKEDPTWLEPHVELATVYYRLHRPADGAKERQIVEQMTAEQQSKGPGKQ